MNEGLIATRYAKALFEFAQKAGQTELVYGEANSVLQAFAATKPLGEVLANPSVSRSDKRKLLVACAGEQPSTAFLRFVELITDNEREKQFRVIMLKFIDLYRTKNNIRHTRLATAIPLDTATEERIVALVQKTLGGSIELQTSVERDLIGGFRIEVDCHRWDASVSGALRKIKQEFAG